MNPNLKLKKFIPAVSCTLLLTVFVLAAWPARAQDEQNRSQLRTVHGSVLDHADNPVPNGIVYLHNRRTNNVRTYIADSAGKYRFSGLDPNVDFDIHAEYKGAKSSTHTISTYDDRRDIEINLFLHKKK